MKSQHNGNDRRQATAAPDASHIKNVDVAYEVRDVELRGILTFMVGLTIMTIVVYLLMVLMFNLLSKREEVKPEEHPSPMALSSQDEKYRLPPEPRLQGAKGFAEQLQKETGAIPPPDPLKGPKWEIEVLDNYWNAILTTGKDPSGKSVGLPIEEAKDRLLKSGTLPAAQIPEEGPGWRAQDYGVDMPTAASSGRMTEKRKQ